MPAVKVWMPKYAVVGQHLHQRQRGAGGHRRARHRQGHLAQPARQAGAQQARGLHQLRRPLDQRGARQQVHVGIEREREHPGRAPHAAHLGQQPPLQAEAGAQPALQRAGKLQEVGVGIGRDIGRHGQRQQQQPFEAAPARKVEHRHQQRRRHAHGDHAEAHHQRQLHGHPQVFGQHGGGHLAQDLRRLGVPLRPGADHRQHRQRQGAGQQHEDQGGGDAHGRIKQVCYQNESCLRMLGGRWMPFSPLTPGQTAGCAGSGKTCST